MKKTKTLKPLIFWIVYASVMAACILIDQLTKYFIGQAANNVEGWTKRIFPHIDWLYLHWTLNDGATGGIFSGMKGRNVLFFIMTIIGLPVFGYMLYRSRTRSVWGQVAFSFIIGGTLGNAIDRLFFAESGFFTGRVRDFVHVTWFFGIFNMADSFLVVGVILALLAIVFFDPDSLLSVFLEERKKKTAAETSTESTENVEKADVQSEQTSGFANVTAAKNVKTVTEDEASVKDKAEYENDTIDK